MSPSMILGRVVIPLVCLALAVGLAWQTLHVSTPGRAPAAERPGPAASSGRIVAEGRVVAYPGAEVVVSSEVVGTVINMPVHENMVVGRGDLLVELRADDVRASLREAQANLAETEANLQYLQDEGLNPDRMLTTPPARGVNSNSPAQRRDLSVARARRDAAKATVERLEAELSRYRIVAPTGGTVVARHVDQGETVSPATPLLTIADLQRLRVEAEVDEYDAARIAARLPATITAEGYPAQRWQGEVEEVGAAVVNRINRPEDPSRPTDTRVLPVEIRLLEHTPLRLGQRVEVEIRLAEPAR